MEVKLLKKMLGVRFARVAGSKVLHGLGQGSKFMEFFNLRSIRREIILGGFPLKLERLFP